MSTNPAATRPGLLRDDTELLAHRRDDIRNVPVTPAFGSEASSFHHSARAEPTINDYFGFQRRMQRNVISATFTIPRILHRKESSRLQTDDCFYRSAHLDCLSYLSADPTCLQHTIIAWTGEISRSKANDDGVSDLSPSAAESMGGCLQEEDESNAERTVFISSEEQRSLEADLDKGSERIVPVWLYRGTEIKEDGIELKNQSKWREYAEHDLYPLFHYKQREPTGGVDEGLRWNDYHRANAAFADTICKTYKHGDVVLVHDCYLMLAPKMVRQQLPEARIAFLLQTPFPTSEFVRCLPRREELLEGVLGADVVVFQAPSYAEHFVNSCARILRASAAGEHISHRDGRRVQVAHIPTGINTRHVLRRAFRPSVDRRCEELADTFAGKKVVLGHDPVDRLSGLDKKLQAYERFLQDRPEWREGVVLLQMTSPGPALEGPGRREDAEYAARINVLVGAINARFGSLGHTPVQLVPLPSSASASASRDEYFALLRRSDLALVTSVREGISTMALEYAVCQREGRGTLILSEFSGTAGALSRAVVINPWDIAGVAREIHAALTSSEARRGVQHAALFRQVQEMSVGRWARKLFDRIEAIPENGV